MLQSTLPLPDLRPAEPPADITFALGRSQAGERPTGDLLRRFTLDDDDWLLVYKTADSYTFVFQGTATFTVDSDEHIEVRPEPGTRPETVRHLLIDQVIPLHLVSQGETVLHASAVSIETAGGARAILFLGPTGAGKSSTAVGCSARDATLLADDFALIDPQVTPPAVWPADVGVRLWDDVGDAINTPGTRFPVAEYTDKKRLVPRADVTMEHPAPVPIGAVVVLAQRLRPGAAPDLTASSPADAVIRVVENSHRIDVTSATANRKALDKAAQLVEAVPFLRLRLPGSIDCLLDNCSSALELVRERVERESVRRSALGKR